MATIMDLSKLDIRIGKVLLAEDIEGARSPVYKLTIYLGDEIGMRTIIAGIKNTYTKDDLKDRLVVCIINLEPKRIANVMSEGMILATEENSIISLLTPEKAVSPGSIVR
ncbi:MAG: tRNA-binding protein [Candidatus Micrarchaeia archaeon]